MGENGHKVIEIPATLTVRELAETIQASPIDVIKQLMANGVMANINQQIDFDTAAIVMAEFGFEAHPLAAPEAPVAEAPEMPVWRRWIEGEDPKQLGPRPPVVTILGHVDHGKTTLLDAIRKTNVAEGEAGGITQHIAAYQVKHKDQLITFLDTPGHAAFTAMRARGAQGADIAVLVVAADDGVMPQTREALAHARAARVPIIVALNKIDRDNANPDRVKQQLADVGLIADDWDGDTLIVPVSAKKGTGLEDLLEAIVMVTSQTDIRANPKGKVIGTVLEAELDRAKGVVTTLLVQNGTLRTGDVVVAGTAYGRIRAMFDFQGAPVQSAVPSTPVSVLGLSDVPTAGELFRVAEGDKDARAAAEAARVQALPGPAEPRAPRTLEQVFQAFQDGQTRDLRLVVKGDVQGSLEPIVTSLKNLGTAEIPVNVLHSAAGNITENDVMLAAASNAIVLGFSVTAEVAAMRAAEKEHVDVRLYDVIYRMTEDIEKALKGMLEPVSRQVVLGRAEVRAVFRIPKGGQVAGCRVVKGELRRNSSVRVLRGDQVVHEGQITSLRHEKEDVREIREGFECGVGVKGFTEFAVGDLLESFTEEKVPAV